MIALFQAKPRRKRSLVWNGYDQVNPKTKMNDRILYTAREPKRRIQHHSKKFFWFSFCAILLILLMAVFVYVLRMPNWRIQEIELSGLKVLGAEEVKVKIKETIGGEYIYFLPRNSFFLLNTASLADFLRGGFPRIETVAVDKKFPDLLRVSVKERQPFGIFCNLVATSTPVLPCVYVDRTGFAYETAPSSSGSLFIKIKSNLPEARVGEKIDPQLMDEILSLGEQLKKRIDLEAVDYEFYSNNPRELKVKTSDGFKVIFMRGEDWNKVFHALKTVLNQEIKEKRSRLEYIDLRFGNKVFYRYKN